MPEALVLLFPLLSSYNFLTLAIRNSFLLELYLWSWTVWCLFLWSPCSIFVGVSIVDSRKGQFSKPNWWHSYNHICNVIWLVREFRLFNAYGLVTQGKHSTDSKQMSVFQTNKTLAIHPSVRKTWHSKCWCGRKTDWLLRQLGLGCQQPGRVSPLVLALISVNDFHRVSAPFRPASLVYGSWILRVI